MDIKKADKKTLLFLPLLFVIFFFLIAITGFFQYRVIKKNMDELLKKEADIIFNHLNTEIDQGLEYLSIAERSPSLVPSDFTNILTYDETIIGDLYYMLRNTDIPDLVNIPVSNILVMDSEGNIITQKGSLKIQRSDTDMLLKKKKDTFVRMSGKNIHSLTMGLRVNDRAIFLRIDNDEFNALRKIYIIRDIIDREIERFNIKRITIYDDQGRVYIDSNSRIKDGYLVSKNIKSRVIQGYRMDIYLSRDITDRVLDEITTSFFLILLSLIVVGGVSTVVVFVFMGRYERHIEDVKKEIALNERLISLGNLASGMAHEIRNPLNAMSLSIQRLKREFAPVGEKKEEYERFIDIMRNEIIRVNRIVEEFLSSIRNQTVSSRQNLYSIIDEVTIILKEEADSKGIEIHNQVDSSLYIECQKERLKQAFHNIILNSIQAIEARGVIEIKAIKRESEIDIIIRDTGIGIKEEDIESIFDYYYTTKDKGIGLGLAISYLIIKDHGGSIKVKSKEGEGTTFIITMPTERRKATDGQ